MTDRAPGVADRPPRPRVVVLGAGFAGLNAAHALQRADADVTVLDKNNYHTFQPLLYQVSTGYLAAEEVGATVRTIFRRHPNVTVRMGAAVSVHWADRTLCLRDGSAVAFDYLILAAGAETNYFGIAGMAEHSWPLYTLDDAVRLRMHLLNRLEETAATADYAGVPITAVVVGGGPTGVETAGALASMGQELVGPATALRVTLVEAGPRLLAAFSPRSSRRALEDLQGRGVEVRLRETVDSADAGGVTLADGHRIDTDTVIWAAGVAANPLGAAFGLEVDRHGRILVDPQLQVPGHSNVFAAGDLAVTTPAHGAAPPMLASAAIQTGRHAGEQVAQLIAGGPVSPFRYHDKGIMAVLGRGDAVAELPLRPAAGGASRYPLRFGGLPAWLLWLGVHIVYLIGFRNRLKILCDWGWSYFTSRGAGAILIHPPDRRQVVTTPPGAAPTRSHPG
ncbi:MAG TPA: NAD(P)/FAD-dependent oxidoreductase [Pseudonocardiaceae bacterium]|jgi:NADH dehydrogenase|nr:NAD(P)/FAD-dependent oxidoreductase [Pseudonocardiaceae bacterium]